MSQVDFANVGENVQPSPTIWADSPNTLLNDKGLGVFGHEGFQGNITDSSYADGEVIGSGVLNSDGDTAAIAPKAAEVGGYVTVTTGANDNDAIAFYSPLLAPISRKSGVKLWAEARFEFTTLPDAGFFFGFGEEAALVRDVVADNPSNSAVAGLITESLVGFASAQASSAIATLTATYGKDAGTKVVVLSDVTQGTGIPLASRFNLAAVTELKLGLRFDGDKFVRFYVNGYEVAALELDSTFDQSKNMGMVFAYKTGSANARSVSVDWLRYAVQSRA